MNDLNVFLVNNGRSGEKIMREREREREAVMFLQFFLKIEGAWRKEKTA